MRILACVSPEGSAESQLWKCRKGVDHQTVGSNASARALSNLLGCKLECRQYSRLEAFCNELREQQGCFRAILPLVNWAEVSVQQSSGFTATSNLANRSEHNRAHHPTGRSISENHVFSPSCHPHLPTLTTNK